MKIADWTTYTPEAGTRSGMHDHDDFGDALAAHTSIKERDEWAKEQLDPTHPNHNDPNFKWTFTYTTSGDGFVLTMIRPDGSKEQYDMEIKRHRYIYP